MHVDGTVLDDYRARLLAQREAAAGGGEAKTEDGAVKTEPGAEGTTVKSEGGDAGPSAVKKEEGGDGSVEVKTEQDSKVLRYTHAHSHSHTKPLAAPRTCNLRTQADNCVCTWPYCGMWGSRPSA